MDLLEKRQDIIRIAARHGARNVRLFGSVARGEDRPESDIDLLVEMASDRSLLDLVGLSQDLEELLGRRVDVLTDASLHKAIRERIFDRSQGAVNDDRFYLGHIRDALRDIQEYAASGHESFAADRMRQDAVIRKSEIIGEAGKKLSDPAKQAHPGIPWKQIAGMRDRLTHGYFGVDLNLVWRVIERDLPMLSSAVEALLADDLRSISIASPSAT